MREAGLTSGASELPRLLTQRVQFPGIVAAQQRASQHDRGDKERRATHFLRQRRETLVAIGQTHLGSDHMMAARLLERLVL